MLSELAPSQFPSIKALLGKYIDYPVVNAVLEGNAPGRIFTNHYTQFQSACVLTNAGFSYLLGSPHNGAFNQALKELLDSEILPAIQASDDPSLILYPLADGWGVPIKGILGNRKIYDLFRKQFTFNQENFDQLSEWREQVPTGFSLHLMDQSLLEEIGANMFPWESVFAFLDKGFGFWVMAGKEIACECSSAFASRDAVEINIHTKEKYQRQGLATISASAFIQECLDRGLRPNWECWWDNLPSISLAKKLGFQSIGDHAVFLVELN